MVVVHGLCVLVSCVVCCFGGGLLPLFMLSSLGWGSFVLIYFLLLQLFVGGFLFGWFFG